METRLLEVIEAVLANAQFDKRLKETFASYGYDLVYAKTKEFKYRWVALFEARSSHYWSAHVDVPWKDMPTKEVFCDRIVLAFQDWLKRNKEKIDAKVQEMKKEML